MDRSVPRTGSEEIELYIRTYYSLLRSSGEVQVQSLVEAHANMDSTLHVEARGHRPDMAAFIYSVLRLPACVTSSRLVLMGQSYEVFARRGYPEVESWQPVAASARRRRWFYDGAKTLACYIASRSDIDDLIPILTAFQIEWNKFHERFKTPALASLLQSTSAEEAGLPALAEGLDITPDDLYRLRVIWGAEFMNRLREMAEAPKCLRVNLLAGSLNDYRRATQSWLEHASERAPSVKGRPVYFVSSNTHSLINSLSGYALRLEPELIRFIERPEHVDLLAEWRDIEARHVPSSRENFLYYVLKKYVRTPEGQAASRDRLSVEIEAGIYRVPSRHSFDIEAQVVELARLRPDRLDPRLQRPGMEALQSSDALICNIDYPLGMAAYLLLAQVAERAGEVRGVYVMGKAATLNGAIGDVMIPNVVYDEHSLNTYLFQNCFTAADVRDSLVYGNALDNQKAVTVLGTFLQNARYMGPMYKEGYTDIEMEAGPYLSAVYEMLRPIRHPSDEIVSLYGLPFDIGIMHYASDTPLSKGRNLGAGNLSYFGMDPTYATTIAIARRIFDLELRRQAPHHS